MTNPQFIINHESCVTLKQAFHVEEKINMKFYVVEGNKFVVTITAQKDSKKKE
jgi:hypothetical protein